MRTRHAEGVEGARSARGVAVVIDVLRAFTVTAYALAGGAHCRLVASVEEARALAAQLPGAVLSAEIDGMPVPGIPISNSPSAIAAAPLGGRTLIQRTTSGVQAALAAEGCEVVLAAALVNAAATARRLQELAPPEVTLVASGAPLGHPEDRFCAERIEALIDGRPPAPLAELERMLAATDRIQRVRAGAWPGFPSTDLDLALQADRFYFAMSVLRQDGEIAVRPVQGSR
ncbi:MAG TPA: 2-phosphosulfolactate phosphatase [Candidatus Dormibacteraeota bacterium]